MRVLVCGGRYYADWGRIYAALDAIDPRITFLIQGGAKGADRIAGDWATSRAIPTRIFKADWKKYDNAAGPIRNQQMLDEGKPDLVIAFPGGNGTADMVRRARAAGVEVREYDKDPSK